MRAEAAGYYYASNVVADSPDRHSGSGITPVLVNSSLLPDTAQQVSVKQKPIRSRTSQNYPIQDKPLTAQEQTELSQCFRKPQHFQNFLECDRGCGELGVVAYALNSQDALEAPQGSPDIARNYISHSNELSKARRAQQATKIIPSETAAELTFGELTIGEGAYKQSYEALRETAARGFPYEDFRAGERRYRVKYLFSEVRIKQFLSQGESEALRSRILNTVEYQKIEEDILGVRNFEYAQIHEQSQRKQFIRFVLEEVEVEVGRGRLEQNGKEFVTYISHFVKSNQEKNTEMIRKLVEKHKEEVDRKYNDIDLVIKKLAGRMPRYGTIDLYSFAQYMKDFSSFETAFKSLLR